MVDEDVLLRNGGADAAEERVFGNLDRDTCRLLKFLGKCAVFRRKIDRNLIVLCEIQSFFDLAGQISFIFRSFGKGIQKFFYFREKFLF